MSAALHATEPAQTHGPETAEGRHRAAAVKEQRLEMDRRPKPRRLFRTTAFDYDVMMAGRHSFLQLTAKLPRTASLRGVEAD
jgi:hypothetical protein